MENTHIKPFAAAIENGIEMVMAAHLHCTCFDEKVIPASLSVNAVSYLRNKLKFNGIIISDDMMMKGFHNLDLQMLLNRASAPVLICLYTEIQLMMS